MRTPPPPHARRQSCLLTGATAVALGVTSLALPAVAAPHDARDHRAVATSDLRPAKDLRPAAGRTAALGESTRSGSGADTASARKGMTSRRLSVKAPALGTAAAADPGCAGLDLQANQLRDRTWILWNVPAGATGTATVSRLRDGSATWQTVGSAAVTTRAVLDSNQSPAGPATYRLSFPVEGTTVTCYMTDQSGDPVTGLVMFPDAGAGLPDFAAAISAPAGLQMQNDASVATPVNPASPAADAVTPAFSPDGQWLAYGQWSSSSAADLVVQRADGRGSATVLQAGASSPAAPISVEPSFSPNGRLLAWARYQQAADDKLVPLDIQIRDLYTGTTRTLPAPYGTPTWDRDSRSLVAVRYSGTSSDLVKVDSSSGDVTALSGTTGGYDPTIAGNGVMVFASDTSAGPQLKVRANTLAGTASTVRFTAPTAAALANPRLTRDRSTIYFRMDTDLGTPEAQTGVYQLGGSATQPDLTAIGASSSDATSIAYSFDLRQASGKGNSDLTNDGANDLISKDASGNLWLYPNSRQDSRPMTMRTQIGTGWNIYDFISAAGDLNDDGVGDILARDTAGNMYYYRGNGSGGVEPRISLGRGWGGYLPLSVGDWDRDTNADIVARDTSGQLWLYRGTGRDDVPNGFVNDRILIGRGWGIFNSIVGIGDANYDNKADMLARRADNGQLALYGGPGDASTNYAGAAPGTTASFAAMSQLIGPERYSAFATSLTMVDSAGNLVDSLFTGDGRLAFPETLLHVSGGGSSYRWSA